MQEEEGWQTADRTEGSNPQTLRGAASGVVLTLLSPLPCLAQEHSGLFAIAGICRGYGGSAYALNYIGQIESICDRIHSP